jgi:hypothetical protein
MPADDLPRLSSALTALAERRAAAALAGGVESWRAWWERAAADPVMAGPMAERATLFGGADHPASFVPPAGWHLAALEAAGFAEAGVAWRSGTDAIVAAIR